MVDDVDKNGSMWSAAGVSLQRIPSVPSDFGTPVPIGLGGMEMDPVVSAPAIEHGQGGGGRGGVLERRYLVLRPLLSCPHPCL